MKRTATFLVILASLLAALLAIGAVSNQTKIVQLIEGETAEIQCVGKKLVIRRISRTQVVAWCVPAIMPTPTQAPTDTPALTSTPTETPTSTPTQTPVPTKTATNTPTETPVPTETPTSTPTETPTSTPTETPVPTKTATNTPTPTDMPVPPTSEGVPRYGLFEMPLPFGEYPHPYYFYDPLDAPENDPGRQSPYGVDGVSVDAWFTTPSGGAIRLPCFWYEDEVVMEWRCRFSPSEVGEYRYYATREDASGVIRYPETGELSFTAVESGNHGFVRLGEAAKGQDERWFYLDDGTLLSPMLSMDATQFYQFADGGQMIRGIAANGGNYFRLWDFASWWALNTGAHYDQEPEDPYLVPLGTWVDQADARKLDRILEVAQEVGVYVQLCTHSEQKWGWDYSTQADEWIPNRVPPDDWRLVNYWKRDFRYRVARWGAFTSVLGWEQRNELGHIEPGSSWWNFYETYHAYQQETDPYSHLTTTSQNAQAYSPNFWSSGLVDYANTHDGVLCAARPELCADEVASMYRLAQCLALRDLDWSLGGCGLNLKSGVSWVGRPRPWIVGEYTITDENWERDRRSLEGESALRYRHNRAWAGVFTPLLTSFGGEWWLYEATDEVRRMSYEATRLAREFVADFDYDGARFYATSDLGNPNYVGSAIQVDNPGLRAMSVQGNDEIIIWILNKDLRWLGPETLTPVSSRVTLPDVSSGLYSVRWFDPWTGEQVGDELVEADGSLVLEVADLERDTVARIAFVGGQEPTDTPQPTSTPTGTPTPAPGPDGWHQLAGNAQHTGYSSEMLPQGLKLLWQWNGSCQGGGDCRPGNPDEGWSTYAAPNAYVVAGGGRLYLPSYDGVWAIDQETGRTAWHNAEVISLASAVYTDGYLYVAGQDGKVYRLDAMTGNHDVIFDTSAEISVAPAWADNRLYVAAGQTLWALDPDGNEVWRWYLGSTVTVPPVVSTVHDRVVVGLYDLRVVALDLDGNLVWQRNPSGREPGWDSRYQMPVNYYDYTWPVISDQVGVVFVRAHVRRDISYRPPENSYPATSAEIRAYLAEHEEQQTLFALRLEDGQDAYDLPLPVGPGGIETQGVEPQYKGWTAGSPPVVLPDGTGYTMWRAKNNNPDPANPYGWAREGGVCKLDLATGDCRYVQFSPHIPIDEMGALAANADGYHYVHWLYMSSWRVSDDGGDPVPAQRRAFVLNRIGSSTRCQYSPSLYCKNGMGAYCTGQYYNGPGWAVFWDTVDPPYVCSSAYSDGAMPRGTIVDGGKLFYQMNGSTVVALGGTGALMSTPGATGTATRTPTETPTSTPTETPVPTKTATNTPTPTETPTSTPTETPVPTKTATNTPTETPVPTETPTSTPTETPVPTETPTSTPTETPVSAKTATNTPFRPVMSGLTLTNYAISRRPSSTFTMSNSSITELPRCVGLLSDSCSSEPNFALRFLQTPPRNGRPCFG